MPRNQAQKPEDEKPEGLNEEAKSEQQTQSAPQTDMEKLMEAMSKMMDAKLASIQVKPAADTPSAAPVAKAEGKTVDPFELVPIMLPLDKQHTEPLHVSVNEYSEKIPRGVVQHVPYYVAKHIEEMGEQNMHTIRLVAGLVDTYERKAREVGLG
jgi:hypothetical protein